MELAATLAELVRLPAVLSVPGDALTGAAMANGGHPPRRALGACVTSAGLYLGGMALNDWADRRVDAVERPSRPIPSGRVTPRTALAVAVGLTAAGLAVARAVGGRRMLRAAAATAATAWCYDLAAKSTVAGPATMGAARALDVLLGAATVPGGSGALPAAAVVGLHTAVTTALSAHEATGGAPEAARGALMGTGAVTVAAAGLAAMHARGARRLLPAAALLGAYALTVGRAQAAAARTPDAATVQRAVGAGILGLPLLEAALLASAGAALPSAAIAGTWPIARTLARRRAVT